MIILPKAKKRFSFGRLIRIVWSLQTLCILRKFSLNLGSKLFLFDADFTFGLLSLSEQHLFNSTLIAESKYILSTGQNIFIPTTSLAKKMLFCIFLYDSA